MVDIAMTENQIKYRMEMVCIKESDELIDANMENS
jgi:hypothetical protein